MRFVSSFDTINVFVCFRAAVFCFVSRQPRGIRYVLFCLLTEHTPSYASSSLTQESIGTPCRPRIYWD